MGTQRMIEFETTSDEGAERIVQTLSVAFEDLAKAQPKGVRLAYWRVSGSRRFTTLIELADENANPLMGIDATRVLPGIIEMCVQGGYPRPEIVEQIGRYNFHSFSDRTEFQAT